MAVVLFVAAGVMLGLFVLTSLRAVTRLARRVNELDEAVLALQAERARTDGELARVDVLLDRADKISTRVESTSRLAYNTLAAPVIKAFAVSKGTSEAARSLRNRAKS